MDQQKLTELVIGLATILAAVYLIESGAISGTVGFAAIVAVAAALGAYEAGRKQPQPVDEDDPQNRRER